MSGEDLDTPSQGAAPAPPRSAGLLERLRAWFRDGTLAPSAAPCRRNLPPGERLRDALDDAECLLRYAVEAGITVQKATVAPILAARFGDANAWKREEASRVLAAMAELSTLTRPVTGETLHSSAQAARQTMTAYRRFAIILAVIILPLSALSFVVTGLSRTVTDNVKAGNEMSLKFVQSIGNGRLADATRAPILETDLQQFSVLIRELHARAVQLGWLTPSLMARDDPRSVLREDTARNEATTQLPVPLVSSNDVAIDRVKTYQAVRSFAAAVQNDAELIYGAIGAVVLPVLYALLGCCAYLLRLFSDQIQKRTFAPSYANPSRLLTAAISGAVVGLFNNFTISQGASISPLATAFVVGYAVDVFFSFLDSLLLPLSQSRTMAEFPAPRTGWSRTPADPPSAMPPAGWPDTAAR